MSGTLPTHAVRRSTDNDHRERIGRVLRYIREHLDTSLQLAELARTACFSPFHFHRIFAAHVGETVSEYIRRERLEAAARDLITGRTPIAEIGAARGYDTAAAFTKAFRRYFGMSPSAYRAQGDAAVAHNPTRAFNQPHARRITMQPEFRTLPDQRVLCVVRKGLVDGTFTNTASAAFETLMEFVRTRNLYGTVDRCLGICPDDPSVVDAAYCRYIAGFRLCGTAETDGPVATDVSVEMMTIPAGRWAVFTHHGPYEGLGETWNAVYRDWLPTSGEQLRDTAPYEIYLNDKSRTAPEDLITEICIPIA